jgi:hypothetical protein
VRSLQFDAQALVFALVQGYVSVFERGVAAVRKHPDCLRAMRSATKLRTSKFKLRNFQTRPAQIVI